jgi:hypothetical protein
VFTYNERLDYYMIRFSKYILIIGMIMLIACVGSVTAAVPHACAQCSPATYPGSDTCPQACVIAFPADTEWAYPEVEATVEEIEEEGMEYLTSKLSGVTLTVPTIDPEVSKLSGVALTVPESNPLISKLSGVDISDEVP